MNPCTSIQRGAQFRALFLALLWISVAGSAAWAQATNAIIQGTVTDSSGAVVAGAAIQVKNVATGVSRSTVSDSQGRFTVPDLLVGDYEAQASIQGFQTVVRKGLTLAVGMQAVVDFALPPGQQQQTVTVEARFPKSKRHPPPCRRWSRPSRSPSCP